MKNGNVPVLSKVMYVISGILGLYSAWGLYYSVSYLREMVNYSQLVVKGNEFEIASFIMSNFGMWAVFTVILFALGKILKTILPVMQEEYDEEYDEKPEEEPGERIEEKTSPEVAVSKKSSHDFKEDGFKYCL